MVFCKKLTDTYGNSYKLRMLGGSDVIFIKEPQLYSQVLANDGQYPVQVLFDTIRYTRKHDLNERFRIAGFLAHGQEWLEFRKAVQQDMMRPKVALQYIQELYDVIDSVENKIGGISKADGKLEDILALTKEFTLESIAVIFYGKRMHVLDVDSQLSQGLIDANFRF